MKQRYALLFAVGLTIMLLFVSCQSETEQAISTSSIVTVTSTAVFQLSAEPLNAPTVPLATAVEKVETPPPTIFAPPMNSSATLPAPTVTTQILTPLPTLTGEALDLAVAELLANPMNCDVPCWWGAIPGITTINEIKYSLAPYNFGIYEYEEYGEVIHLRLDIEYVGEKDNHEFWVVYNFSNSVLSGVTAYSPTLSEFLTRHGSPDEIWLETMSVERETLPVRLNMVYLQEGIAVGYVVDGDIYDGMAVGCFAGEEMGQLRLISPNAVSYEDFSPVFEEGRRYLLLEEATGLTIEDFMQRFSDPTQPQCIETPAELWE